MMSFLNNKGASSSFSFTRRWNYDVFLSFRGEDTRESFTSHLYKALCHKGFNTFIDDKLWRGEEISEELIQTIKKSSILVVVFSKKYAESKWCLDELVEIVDCSEKHQEVQIHPVFYNIEPSEIRNQKGNFGRALANHEMKFKSNKDKVQRWRDALRKVANAFGWHYKKGCSKYKSESHFIQNIVEKISSTKLNWTPLYVAEYLVGINSRAEVIVSLLDIGSDEFCMVGIHGLPRVGKTTIAKAVYNEIAKHFDRRSFLENVRESLGTDAGIITLQEQLLKDILGDGNWRVGNKSRGISFIEERLHCKKVLLILDDVDDSTRIENLLGKCNWFAPGSRVILTLRDRCLLDAFKEKLCTTYKVKEFKVEQLNKHEALQLFKDHAFSGNKLHDEDYSNYATKFVDFAKGLPLALEIIARDLCGKAKNEWQSALDMYNEFPNKDIQKILRVSYDGLHDTEKDIFLDIACFFKGWYKDYVLNILNACGLCPNFGIPRLVKKCLITVDKFGRLSMHDLIQQMGKEVVRQQAPDILRERSRLCCYKDSLKVLTTNKGSKKIRGIMLHSPQPIEVQLHIEALRKMENLKFLIVENVHICRPLEFLPNNLILLKWPHYPFHWPSEYFPEQLVAIEMPHSCIRLPKLIMQQCRLENLKEVNFEGCEFIRILPKLWAPNLEVLNLGCCKNLVKLQKLWAPNLEVLNLGCCKNLVKLQKLWAPNLEVLKLGHCKNLDKLPKLWAPNLEVLELNCCENLVKLPKLWAPNLVFLDLRFCKNLVEIDECFASLEKLRIWCLSYCIKLQFLPSQLRLKSLYSFQLFGCSRLEKLPDFHQEMECLEHLYISCSGIREVPSSIEHLTKLKTLTVENCKNLRDLPDSICKLQRLRQLGTSTTKLRQTCNSFDSSSEGYEAIIELDLLTKPDYFPLLETLGLSETNIVTIPESISRFPKLRHLEIWNCKLLREIQGLPQSITTVNAENCMSLDYESTSGLLNQVVENIGVLPNRVCGSARSTNYFPSESEDGDISMDRQFSNHFPSETKGVEYEDQDVHRYIYFCETEMPKWFNHQSVENSIFFWVGRKFPKLAVCFIVPRRQHLIGHVCISINSYKKREFKDFLWSGEKWRLRLFSPSQRSLQEHLNKSNPTDQNHVEVTYSTDIDEWDCIKRLGWGVHVECTCPPQESAIPNLPLLTSGHDDDHVVDYWRELPFYVSDDKEEYQSPLVHDDDDVDYWRELPFYGSDDKEEYQSPLVHDDTSMSCMSWLVGPTTKLFKLFCFCCTRDFS
ncbi:disease resistance protein RML1A-like [Castanea sativa]|uniref:disease resistance protein RML1A-like n=1 Tax=Castanea sativa TaxID=21020 RepID=UPI003F64962A